MFHFHHSKTYKQPNKAHFTGSKHCFLSSRLLQNLCLRSFLRPFFDLRSFECFASLSQKMVSFSSLRKLQESGKFYFQTLVVFVFGLKIAPKPFSKKVPMPIFWFKKFWTLRLTFLEYGFTFVTQKLGKIWKMLC